MEKLNRGLIAARTEKGMYLSWRYLGNEPDGIRWRIYRKRDEEDWRLLAELRPRDVPPESRYEGNPGIVKKNTTPCCWTDPEGREEDRYAVAPVTDAGEGLREEAMLPVLEPLAGAEGQAWRAAVHRIPLCPPPERVPLAHFMYRGVSVGPGCTPDPKAFRLDTGEDWYRVDMDLLRAFREPWEKGEKVAPEQLRELCGKLNRLGGEMPELQPLPEDGRITDEMYREMEAAFIRYVRKLDSGEALSFARTASGAVETSLSSEYHTQDMSVGDFDGDGEYEIVVKWRADSPDPMFSDPIYRPDFNLSAPEYIDVYKLNGKLLMRIDMGYNVKSGNDHETMLHVQDFNRDGRAEIILKTAPGTRVGYWDEAQGRVVYPRDERHVVGGEEGLACTTDRFIRYFEEGNEAELKRRWSLLNGFDICYRSPLCSSDNDGPNDPLRKAWIKSYHIGPMGPGHREYVTAVGYDGQQGVILDTVDYAFPWTAVAADGDSFALDPMTQRGNFCTITSPLPGADTLDSYKVQVMQEKDGYFLAHRWKYPVWGDGQGNRANRYAGGVACLDGENWYAVIQRGYYQRTTFAAYTMRGSKLMPPATFDSEDPECWTLGKGPELYRARGNHFTDMADIDGDGRDEVVLKGMNLSLSEDGKHLLPRVLCGDILPMVSGTGKQPDFGENIATDEIRGTPGNAWAGLQHGDRSALLPVNAEGDIRLYSGTEEYTLDDRHTGNQYGWLPGPEAHDPNRGLRRKDGELVRECSMIFGEFSGDDDEGSVAGNFSNRWPGAMAGGSECGNRVRSLVDGRVLTETDSPRGIPQGENAVWFGPGLTHYACNVSEVHIPDQDTLRFRPYLTTGLTSTGSKKTPTLKADLFGDWREELILTDGDSHIVIVRTLAPTEYGIRCLMHDPWYRNSAANQNICYNQVGFASFYLGDEAPLPAMRSDICFE
uniref:S-layer domain-containing protein n=1 Tax=uncultured bacterium Contig12 TaxID=1393397 RepID=W0FPJ2_9BACT|nr:s-layer domain-containing protein [uncultured bacterium Contig12]